MRAYFGIAERDSAIEARRKIAEGAGATFETAPTQATMIPSNKPVVAICAVRTGVGKSQTSRYIARYFRDKGLKVAAIRHPMVSIIIS